MSLQKWPGTWANLVMSHISGLREKKYYSGILLSSLKSHDQSIVPTVQSSASHILWSNMEGQVSFSKWFKNPFTHPSSILLSDNLDIEQVMYSLWVVISLLQTMSMFVYSLYLLSSFCSTVCTMHVKVHHTSQIFKFKYY